MSWYVAKSILKLKRQLDERFPNRSRISDGFIGNAEHAARTSDHNPWVKDKNGVGVVTAGDFTFDTNPSDGIGIDCHQLAASLVASRDPRIKYVIFNGQIVSSKQQPWIWRPYNGKNAHRKHLHLSVMADERLFNDESDWRLNFTAKDDPTFNVTVSIPEPFKPVLTLEKGDRGERVKALQEKLAVFGYLKQSEVDSIFGTKTEIALQRFQKDNGLIADGIAGKLTLGKLGL